MEKTLAIDPTIFKAYPETVIGYMVVENLHHVSEFKFSKEIENKILSNIQKANINMQNLVLHPTIAAWRNVYQNCGVKPKTYKSSIESLLKRFLQSEYRGIIPAVDLYNYISASFIVPIGGYNLDSIENTMSLRFINANDSFSPLNGKEDLPININQIAYADDHMKDSIICWMWNHKDSKRTMLSEDVKTGLFIFDGILLEDRKKIEHAQNEFEQELKRFGCNIVHRGLLDVNISIVKL